MQVSYRIKLESSFMFFEKIRIFIESKNPASKTIYDETNRFVEKWSEIGYFGMVKMTPICVILPKVIIVSYIRFFATNAGNDEFDLPFLFW